MKLPDPKKPIQTTVSPWEVAFGQKVDADRLIQEDQEWHASRQRMMDARKKDDAKLLRSAELSKRNAPELKAAPSKLESTLSDLARGAKTTLTEGIPHFVGNISNLLQGLPEVPSEYRRSPGVFQEDLPTSWTEDAANMVLDPSNLVGGAMFKPLGRALKKALPAVVPAVSTAYAGDAEAGGLQKMLQMMYRGRSSFTPIEERAMFMSPTPRYAEEYAKRRVGQIGGDRMVDSYLVDPFGVERRGHNITPEGGGNMQSIIAYPKTGEAEYMGSRKFAKGGLARLASRLAADSAPTRRGVAEVVKEKGGNWLTGSVEYSLSGLKSPYVKGYQEAVERYGPETAHQYAARPPVGAGALNNWIDKQLTKYVKNDMATPGDPIRALAEKGIIHQERLTPNQFGPERARRQGYPNANVSGQSDLARKWEDVSDQAIQTNKAFDLRDKTFYTDPEYYDKQISDNSWLNKVPGETPVYAPDGGYTTSNLGFDHLIDELSNAINPDSGLPRHLQFPADRLDRVSVPQAVERVAEINAWRKALKVEEDLKRANNAATVLHKEYPDKGMKWVELKHNKDLEGTGYRLDEATGDMRDPGYAALQDALKYEGDTMGHCVGGYCDDVASGRSRIYSLRDAKGQPHVTIEVGSQPRNVENQDIPDQYLNDAYEQLSAKDPDIEFKDPEAIDRLAGDLWRKDHPDDLRIVQIKGKQNRAPNPEYLPMVQDFVRSGQWSDVGDLQNSGLTAVPKESPLAQRLYKEGREVPSYMTDAEYEALTTEFGLPKYAHGGSIQAKPVKTVQDIQAIIDQLFERQFHA